MNQTRELTLTEQQPDLTLNIQLQRQPRGGSISGAVTDSAGQRIAGASVTNHGSSPTELNEARTDSAGKFTLDNVGRGFFGNEIVVRAPGYAPIRQRFEPTTDAAAKPLAISLPKGHAIRARVQDNAGRPIAGAYVDINGGSYPGQIGESLRTDKDGIFASSSLPAGSAVRIYAHGYSTIRKATLNLDSDETVVFTLQPEGVIRGQVVDESGSPIKQFRVRLDFTSTSPGDVQGTFPSESRNPGITFQSPDGRFSIKDMTNGLPLMVIIEAEGFAPAKVPRVVALPEAEAMLTKITVKRAQTINYAALAGTVVDHAGNAVSGVQLRLIVSPSPSNGDNDNRFNWTLIESGQLGNKDYVEQYLSTVTTGEGNFEFSSVLTGKFLQLAYWGPAAPKGRTLALAKTKAGVSQSVTIQLPEPATIRGSFAIAAFPNAHRVSLSLQGQPFFQYNFELATGRQDFAFANLPPGKYWLSLTGQPQRHEGNSRLFSYPNLASRRLSVEAGQSLEVRFTKDDQVPGSNP